MHRVDTKHRRTKVLRLFTYGITITLTVLTTVLLLYISLGYRLDSKNGHVIRSGLLLVDTKPEAAQIYINNQLKDNAAPGRFVLTAGNYNLTLKRNGYRDWAKSIAITASGVREVQYPFLIPIKLDSTKLGQMAPQQLVSQSQDRKLLLSYSPAEQLFKLTVLEENNLSQTDLPLPPSLRRESGQLGNFRVIEWALNNRLVLLEQTLPSGAVDLISFDVGKPQEAINITALYGAESPSDIHYVGGNTDKIYGLKNGVLSRYSLQSVETETLLPNIRSYQPYADDTVLFDRISATKQSEVGIYHDKTVTVIRTDDESVAPAQLQYVNYDDHFYFAVARSDGEAVIVYRDPLKKPILLSQLPFVTLKFKAPKKIKFSASGQFLLVQDGTKFMTYDFDDFTQYLATLPFELTAGSFITWVDSAHLQAVSADNYSQILDYDGLNVQKMVEVRPTTDLYWAPNYQYAYHLINNDAATSLQTVGLVAK